MHFEILVEGQSELTTLSILMEKMIGKFRNPHTWKIHKHRGIGSIPQNPAMPPNRADPSLLHNLPAKLRAYGNEKRADLVVIVLVDLDDRPDCRLFKQELLNLVSFCTIAPTVLFRIAVEEIEAWFLGDTKAIKSAYPDAKIDACDAYIQDSQCGTWEKLAEVVDQDGMTSLIRQYGKRSKRVLEQKIIWAKKISPHMDIENNKSPSFVVFKNSFAKYQSVQS